MNDAAHLGLRELLNRSYVSDFSAAGYSRQIEEHQESLDDRFRKSLDGLLNDALNAGKSVAFDDKPSANQSWSSFNFQTEPAEHQTLSSGLYGLAASASAHMDAMQLKNSSSDLLFQNNVDSESGFVLNSTSLPLNAQAGYAAYAQADALQATNEISLSASAKNSQNASALNQVDRMHHIKHTLQASQQQFQPQHVHVLKQNDGYAIYIRDANVLNQVDKSGWFFSKMKQIKTMLSMVLGTFKEYTSTKHDDVNHAYLSQHHAKIKSIWVNGQALYTNHQAGVVKK